MVTVATLGLGLAAAAAAFAGWRWTAVVFWLVSRIGDGLDGVLARTTGRTSAWEARRAATTVSRGRHGVTRAPGHLAVTGLSLPGVAIMTLAGGAVFGFVTGTVLVSFASSIGATLAFLTARFLLRDWVQRRFGERLGALNAGIAREGAFYLFALRPVPLFPFWLINLAMGLTTLRTATFYGVSQLGMLAGTAFYVYAGTQLGQFAVSPGLVAAFTLLGVFPLVAKRGLDAIKARLGSRVTQVEMRPRILSREDPDVSALVQRRFEADGVRILVEHKAARMVIEQGEKVLYAEHHGQEVRIPFDAVLVAAGRVANTSGYGLEELGIATTTARTVQTDDYLQTIYPNIFACGDVVARVGLNEGEARATQVPHVVSVYPIEELDRAIVDEDAHGFVKVLTKPGTDQILGTIHTYPTLAEANKYAAGVWKRSTVTRGQCGFLAAFHAWRRGAGSLGGVIDRLGGLLSDKSSAYADTDH